MNIKGDGNITINDKSYKYRIFDICKLLEIIKKEKQFALSLESTIRIYRDRKEFELIDLVKEYIYSEKINDDVYLFIIYNDDDIISTCRFYYNEAKRNGYFNLIYTNSEYRGQKICQHNIKFIIDLTNKYISTYELEVESTNIPALRCYEKIGFVKVKENSWNSKIYYSMSYNYS
jgi:RimJ/RimL family protein N-acetyltransferase